MKIQMTRWQLGVLSALIKTVKADKDRPTLDGVEVSMIGARKAITGKKTEQVYATFQFVRTDSYRLVVERLECKVELNDNEQADAVVTELNRVVDVPLPVVGKDLLAAIDAFEVVFKARGNMANAALASVDVLWTVNSGQPQLTLVLSVPYNDSRYAHTIRKLDSTFPSWTKLVDVTELDVAKWRETYKKPDIGFNTVKLAAETTHGEVEGVDVSTIEDYAWLSMPAFNPEYLADLAKLRGANATVRNETGLGGVPVQIRPPGGTDRVHGATLDMKPWVFGMNANGRHTATSIYYLLMPIRLNP